MSNQPDPVTSIKIIPASGDFPAGTPVKISAEVGAEEPDTCSYCGYPYVMTSLVRDAWQQNCAEDSDVVTEDLSISWTFTPPKQVKLQQMSCGCWRVVEKGQTDDDS